MMWKMIIYPCYCVASLRDEWLGSSKSVLFSLVRRLLYIGSTFFLFFSRCFSAYYHRVWKRSLRGRGSFWSMMCSFQDVLFPTSKSVSCLRYCASALQSLVLSKVTLWLHYQVWKLSLHATWIKFFSFMCSFEEETSTYRASKFSVSTSDIPSREVFLQSRSSLVCMLPCAHLWSMEQMRYSKLSPPSIGIRSTYLSTHNTPPAFPPTFLLRESSIFLWHAFYGTIHSTYKQGFNLFPPTLGSTTINKDDASIPNHL